MQSRGRRLQRTYSVEVSRQRRPGGGNFFDQADAAPELCLIVQPTRSDRCALSIKNKSSDEARAN